VAKMSTLRIHDAADEWPICAGHRFLVSAYQQFLEFVFGLTGADLLADHQPSGPIRCGFATVTGDSSDLRAQVPCE